MEIPTIIVYSPSNNRNRIQLLDGETPVDLRLTTKIALKLPDRVIDSDTYPSVFQWGGTLPIGVVALFLGQLEWEDEVSTADVLAFDEAYYLGIFFGFIRIRSIEDC